MPELVQGRWAGLRPARLRIFPLVVVLGVGGCPGQESVDAGPEPFEGTLVGDGTTECGDIVCQPGQSCRDENLCYLGCERDLECAEGEYCDEGNPAGGVCRAAGPASCGDLVCDVGEHWGSCPTDCDPGACDPATQGSVPCGDSTCGPGTYCANPAEGSCYSGCLSSVNCVCGQRCNASPGSAGSCSVPITPDLPMCGDGVCEGNEAPQNCEADCPWLEDCQDLCADLIEAQCLLPNEGAACQARCELSDDTEREAFAFCVWLSGGPQACPPGCLDRLDDLPQP